MKPFIILIIMISLATTAYTGDYSWYKGDEKCVPPKDDGTYSEPYNALEHQNDYPTFQGAHKPGWSCSYQRQDGIIVQYGDSRTPQEQWLAVWGNKSNEQE